MMLKIREHAFKHYFYFIRERMNIFWRRYHNKPLYTHQLKNIWSNDKIFQEYKFTNVYRILDRVSQYLVRNVIYKKNYLEEDILFRILLFKIFNKIETWEYLENYFGEVKLSNFDFKNYSEALSLRKNNGPIFNSAYILPGFHNKYSIYDKKHEVWLKIINDEFIKGKKFINILNSTSLKNIFNILLETPLIGNFLAYQFTIDFNYSPYINFDENTFVKAGIGAIRGIKKCFVDMGNNSYENIIEFTKENYDLLQSKYCNEGFEKIGDRNPTLIDLQNCFCETDKYLRVVLPNLNIDNSRIKQKYKYNNKSEIIYFFPPKWGINKDFNQNV